MTDYLERAIALADATLGRAHPKPDVGAVLVRDGAVVGEGSTEADGRHGEIVALDAAGKRASGSTLYVTMEPCAHHGTTPPCTEAIVVAGVAKVVVGSRDPNPEAAGGVERLREAGVEVELADSFAARAQNEAWRTWVTLGRPFVTWKVAVTLDGRVAVPGTRWVSGDESRRRVHELRARSGAVAVGMGTVRADNPGLDARGVEAARQPRRLAFGRGPLPAGSELELRTGQLADELHVARRGRRPVASAGRRADPCRRIPGRGARRQAARLRRAHACRRRAADARRPRRAGQAHPVDSRSSRRGCAPECLYP